MVVHSRALEKRWRSDASLGIQAIVRTEMSCYGAYCSSISNEPRFRPTSKEPIIRTQGCKLSAVDSRGTKLYINSQRILAVDY